MNGTAAARSGEPGPHSVPALFRVALLRDGRGRRLALVTLAFMVHQLCEALVPILIGVVIDRALAPSDRSALLWWLGVLGAVFVVLSLSYQRASTAMVDVYGHGEHELRQRVMARLLDPRSLRRRPGPGRRSPWSRPTPTGSPGFPGASCSRPRPSPRS